MKTYSLVLLCATACVVSSQSQENSKPKLLKKPRVYNAIVKSDEELIPSQAYPAVAPVIQPFYTGLFPFAPVIIPQVQPYVAPVEYGSLKAASNYGEERVPPATLTPPSPNQPKPTFRIPTSEADSLQNNKITTKLNDAPRPNGSGESKDFEGSSFDKSAQPLNPIPTPTDDSYFPQDLNTKTQPQSNDFGFLQPPSKPNPASARDGSFQTFFNYQPENSEIPNVPPPPLPVRQNDNNSTKKKIEYPNAPPTFFAL